MCFPLYNKESRIKIVFKTSDITLKNALNTKEDLYSFGLFIKKIS